MSDLVEAKEAVGDFPVLANTGVNHDNVTAMLEVADGAVVGTSMKVDGSTWNPVDPARAARLVELVAACRKAEAGR
jgi:predicted TIM-barrel enzyme